MKTLLLALVLLGQPIPEAEPLPGNEQPVETVAVQEPTPAPPQKIEFTVDGPKEVKEGELVTLTVMFPEGALADVDFVPVEEDNFEVDPVIDEFSDGSIKVVGRKCSFSSRCMGPRTITVVASAYATLANGQPRLKSIKHVITVEGMGPPKPPESPGDDGWVPIPATDPVMQRLDELKKDLEETKSMTAGIFDKVLDRLDKLENAAPATPARVVTPSNAGPVPAVASSGAAFVGERVVAVCGVPVDRAPALPAPSGPHYNIEGDWSTSKAEDIAHLRQVHPSAARRYEPLESLSQEQVKTIHDAAHRGTLNATAPMRQRPMSACPGGVCPTGVQRGGGIFGFGILGR